MSEKKTPLRKCIGCNERKEKGSLLRVVKSPEGTVFVDVSGRANGRGAYLCRNTECFRKGRKNKGLERSLKCKLTEEIFEKLEQEIGQL